MREVIGEASPIVHFPQQVWRLNHWIHVADLSIQFLGRRRNLSVREVLQVESSI